MVDETSQVEECELDSSPDNDDQNEHQPVSVAALKKILMQALAWFFIHKSMSNMSETAYICLDQILFMLSSSADLFDPIMYYPSDEQKTHEEHLDELLKSWQYLRQKVPPDGNCLFHSVYGIQHKNAIGKRKFRTGTNCIKDWHQCSGIIGTNCKWLEEMCGKGMAWGTVTVLPSIYE